MTTLEAQAPAEAQGARAARGLCSGDDQRRARRRRFLERARQWQPHPWLTRGMIVSGGGGHTWHRWLQQRQRSCEVRAARVGGLYGGSGVLRWPTPPVRWHQQRPPMTTSSNPLFMQACGCWLSPYYNFSLIMTYSVSIYATFYNDLCFARYQHLTFACMLWERKCHSKFVCMQWKLPRPAIIFRSA
jgi:hypothetical protein